MKHKGITILIFCVFLAAIASAQEEIEGAGTPNFIARFSGTHTIANSNIFQSPNGNIGIGTTNPLFPLVVTNATGFFNTPAELFVETVGSDPATAAIRGLASTATTGFATFGVEGVTFNPDGIGINGNHATNNGGFGGGVHGQTAANTGFAYGVFGGATGTSGSVIGVIGATNSPQGDGGLFFGVQGASGTILRGNVGPAFGGVTVFRVDGNGTVFADGGFHPSGADFAESMAITGNRDSYSAGDLLVIDPSSSRHLALSQKTYSTLVAGIYSTKPGMLGTTRRVDEPAAKDEVPLAVVGIVPCKASTENGAIEAGDLLVTSSTPGHAMKGTDRSRMLGAVVGKALEPLPEGKGVIEVLVTLQ